MTIKDAISVERLLSRSHEKEGFFVLIAFGAHNRSPITEPKERINPGLNKLRG